MTTHPTNKKRYARRRRVGSLLDAVSDWCARALAPKAASSQSLDLLLLEDRVFFNAAPIGDVAPDTVDVVNEQVDDVINLIDLAVRDHSVDADVISRIDQALVDRALQDSVSETAWEPEALRDDDQADPDQPVIDELSNGQPSADTSYEIVFVDAGVEDYEAFISDIQQRQSASTRYEVVILKQDESGVARISATLSDRQNIDAIHFVSHGSDSGLRLGSDWLTSDNVDGYAWQIDEWRFALGEDADLLIYGCDLASSDAGRELLNSLAAACDCDVAASTNDTGHAIFGGDWDLEYSTGSIETDVAFSEYMQDNWGHLLNVTIDATSVDTTPKGDTSDTFSHTTSGADRLLLVGISFGNDKETSVLSVTYNGTALQLVGTKDNADTSSARVEIWSLIAPDLGAHNVTVNYSDNKHEGATIGAMSFNGVDQTVALGAFASSQGNSGALSTTIASRSGEIVFGVAAFDSNSDVNFAPGAGQTEQWDAFQERANGTGTTEAGAASVVTSWTTPSTGKWAVGGVSIKEAGTSVILSAVADTYVNSGSSGANYGNSTSLVVDKSGGGLGNQHALLEFDLSSIPVGSTITGATLQLQATANTAAFDLNIYEVTEDWAEGTGNATAGAANWNQRLVGTNWSTAGGTVNSTVVATLNTAAIGQHNWNVTSLVQDWFAGTAANNGLLIASPDTGGETVTYDSREGTVAPQLVVSYVAPTSTLVVDTTSDVVNGDTSSIVALLIDKGADNAISLREAIMAMNNTANGAMPDEIHFNIAGVGVHTISLLSPLPNITEAVILDATTQNGYAGIPLIQVVSPVAAGNGFSLQAGSDGSTIRGFIIGGFSGTGVEILSDNNVVELNYIGTNANGTLANGNSRGVEIKGAQNNQVLNNLISGNLGEGIWLNQSVAPGSGNIVQGNLIGTLVNGAGDLGNGLNGIRIESAGNTIGGTGVGQGNTISGNDNNGILLTGINASGNVLLGNKIGVSSSGAVGIRNTFSGVVIENGARLNVIGDSTDAAGKNVISGNTQFGVVIRGTGTQGNTLYGNHIGVDLVGASNIGNLLGGVKIESGATNNYIGRLTSSTHNIISGNTGSGVTIRDSGTNGNLVAGNYIGVSANGSGLLSNTDDGVTIFAGAQNNTIGGTTVNARNVISGNGDEGISIYDASTNGNLVQGNYIGVDAAGTSALGNGDKGISIFNGASNNAIGGGATGASNVIASNVGDGIYIANSGTTGTVIEGNLIGTNSIGSNLGNAGAGIRVVNGASSTTIGGVGPGDGNAIAFNSLGGAVVEGSGTVGNKIRGNSIYANNGLGIDLGNDGVSPNDPLDIDSGPNQLQNRPSLTTSVTVGGNTTITGLLSSTVANTFDLDFYSSPTADPSGSGEGQVYLGSASVVTGLAGTATINTTLTGVTLTLGHVVTATATDSSGNTSEFAANITATAPNSPPTLDLDADNSSGATGNNFQTTFTENLGPVLIVDGDATLTDPDSITIDSATIQITNIMDTAAEVLTANTSGTSIIANFNINTGTLSLTGADTVARYQQVLRTVQYNHTSENPTGGVRLVSFAVDDGMDTVQGVTASVTVNAINDPPAITGPTARTTLVDQPLVFLSSNGNLLTISDPDSGTNAIRVTIAATNGSFSLAGTTGLSFTVGDGTLDSTMTFTGVLGNINNALAGSRYVSNGGYIGAASVQLTAFDLGNSGSGGAKNDTHNVAITVASVSDLAAVPEFLVNTLQTSASQATSNEDRGSSRAIATGSDGSYVVVWTDNHGPDAGVKAQRYNRFGEPLGVNFAVNQTTAGHQRWASVDTDNNGNFVVTWVSENQDGTPRSVYARRFAANGTALSSEFRVNTSSSGTQDNSSVAVDANGDFVVVWEGDGAGGYDIYGRRFDSAGMALGNEFQISATTPDGEPAVAIADDGRFVVVWDDSVGIRARLYEANGNPASAELVVHSESFAGESAVAMDANGNFVVVWRETNAGKDVYYRQFDSLGNPLDVTKQLNTTTANTQTNPSVAVDAAGNFIATWEGRGPGDTDGVFYRRFTAAGVALDAAEVLVNQTTTGTQNQASLAVQNVNNFAVVWSGNGPGDGDGVFVRQFGTANRPPINSVPGMQTVDEDGVLSFHAGLGNALSIVDSDAGANPLSVTLAVSNGVVSLGSLTGLTFVQGDGSADAIQQFQGTLANINSALSNVQYAPNLNFNGSANLTITTDDLGNSGTGGPQVDVDTVAITVNAVNDPPLNALPGAQATNEDTPLVFSIASGNAISVSDLDAGNNMVEVTLAAQQGTLSLSGTSGLMFSSGDGTSDVTTTFRGTLANINAALNGLVYTPTANYFGPASLAVTTNDLGNLGSGGAHSDIDSVTITVTAVNDAPVAMNDASYVISEETMLTIGAASGVLANDTDVDGPALQAVLVSTTANGTLTLSANGSFVYTPATDFFGIDTFTYKANDGSLDSNIATATITVTNVNDAPIARDNGYTVSEDGGQIIGNVITNDSGAGFDTDADGDTLYVLEVNGDRNLVGVPINLASGATLRIDRDGALQYDLNGQFHSLTAGQIANESFTYTIADGWKVRMIQVTGSGIDSTAEAEGILAAATGLGSLSANSETYSVTFFGNTVASEIDYGSGNHDSGINDDFDVNNVFPNGVADGGNDYLVSAISSWTVPAGTYTIALGSDDGGYIRLSGGATFSSVFNSTVPAGSNEIRFDTLRGHGTTGGTFTVAQPTQITLDTLVWDHLLYSSFEISIASGSHTSFNGAVANGGSFQLLQEGTLGWSLTHAHASVSITVQGVNDAPVLNTAAGYTLPPIGDDELNSPGKTVAEILASVSGTPITDADTPVGQIGIAITGRSSSLGTWQYSLNSGVNWTNLPNVSDDSALTLDPTAKLRFVPDLGKNGTASFTWRAWDQTTASNGQVGVDTTPAGGQTAFSSVSAFASIVVADNPQPPQLASESYSVLSNASLAINSPGVLANDYDPDVPAPPLPAPGAKLVYNAAKDVNGNSSWEDSTNVPGFNWSLPASVTRTVNPASLRPGIQAAYNFANAGGTTDSFSTLPGDPSDAPASFEIWFRPVNDGDRDVLFETGGTTDGVSISLDGQTVKFVVRDTEATVAETELSALIDPFEYTQVVGTIDTNTGDVRLYVNGILADSAINPDLHDWAGSDGAGLGRVNSGTNFTGGTNFEGEISLFRFYESALTSAQVLNNYNSVATGLKVISTSSPVGGQLTVLPDGSFKFNPNGAFDPLKATETGNANFAYTVQDGSGLTATATATVTVQGVDDPPITAIDNYSVNSGDELVITNPTSGVLGNDVDPEGNTAQAGTLTATVSTAPAKGTVTLNANGTFSYVANPGAVGTDEFFYVAGDGVKSSQPTRVVITIATAGGPGSGTTGGSSGTGGGSGGDGGGSQEHTSGDSGQNAPPPNNQLPPPAPGLLPGSGTQVITGSQQSVSISAPLEDGSSSASDQDANQTLTVFEQLSEASALHTTDIRDRLRALAHEVVDAAINSSPLASGVTQLINSGDLGFIAQSSGFWQDLDDFEQLVEHDIKFEAAEVASALGVTTTLSVGYVLWFLRGTYLVSCVLAQMPAWRMVDPMFVFAGGDLLGDEDDESLSAMLQKSNDLDHEAPDVEAVPFSELPTDAVGD